MQYELWFSKSDNSYELAPKDGGSPARVADAELVAEFEAASWEGALEFKRRFIASDAIDSFWDCHGMAKLPDVVSLLEGTDPISKDQAIAWLADSDVEIAGAAYAYLEKPRHRSRVTPPLSEDEFAQLGLEYLKRCLLGQQEGEWVQSRFEAAWTLVSWLARQAKAPSPNAVDFVRWLGDSYKTHPELRVVVTTGFLEHVLGSEDVDRLFTSWERDPALAQALRSAREWKAGGGKSPIDLK